jgi:uncharacterized damage-inducible protein DinB
LDEEASVKLTELFIADIDRERDKTRKAVTSVPEGRADWKPHDKAMPLGRLSSMVAMMPAWLAMMIDRDEFDLAPPPGQGSSQFARQLTTRDDLARAVDEGFDATRRALENTSDDHLLKNWQLKAGGTVVQEAPRHVMLRDTLMHLAHHRGQLTTYVRVAGEKVPAIYGPSADEQSF